jgi:Polyketide cyclase / dehydrase and lipid transport
MTSVQETGRALVHALATTGAVALAVPTAIAEVTGVGGSGFEVREQAHIAAAPDAVYAALLRPQRWWDPEHTYSGDARRLTLDAKVGGCWCETMPGGGSVEHLVILYLVPGKAVRFRGALGPLQAMGVTGSMTVKLAAAGGGTELTLTYDVGGYVKDGFDDLSKAVDNVLGSQVARLKKLIETGSAETAAP